MAWTRGTKPAMRAPTQALTRWWRTRHASAGVGSGTAARAIHTSTSWATTAGALRLRWRANYGLDKRSPEDAARWWDDECGMAPAGAVAALGLALRELEARTSRDADWYMAVVWPLLPVPGEFDGMDACDQSRWRSVVRIAIEHTLAGERGMTPNAKVTGLSPKE